MVTLIMLEYIDKNIFMPAIDILVQVSNINTFIDYIVDVLFPSPYIWHCIKNIITAKKTISTCLKLFYIIVSAGKIFVNYLYNILHIVNTESYL